MKRTNVTYGQLDRVLRSLGFARQLLKSDPPAVHYEHKETRALISMPPHSKKDKVYAYHMVIVRTTLELYGIADPSILEAELQRAG
jgi:hypothetical protein